MKVQVLGISASLRNARHGLGNIALVKDIKGLDVNNLVFSPPTHLAQRRCSSLKYRHITALERLAERAIEHRKHQVIYVQPLIQKYPVG